MAHKAITESTTFVLSYHILWFSTYRTDAQQHGIYFSCITKTQIIPKFVYFSGNRVERVLWMIRFWQTWKNNHLTLSIVHTHWRFIAAIWSEELWLFQRNTQLSNLNWASPKRKSRWTTELQSKCAKNTAKWSQSLSSDRQCKLKDTWTFPWILQELKKPLRKLALSAASTR